MSWIELAGYAFEAGWSGQYCVTVYVGGIRFYRPILIGHIVEVAARVVYTGKSSMHIAVDVASKDPRDQGNYIKTTHCIIIFVAMDEEGRPVAVPRWAPSTQEDLELEAYAKKLVNLRKNIEDEMSSRLRD